MLVQHHIKYKEIHGVDEIVLMEKSEHRRLHIHLRKEGKCKVPPAQLKKIAAKAHNRTPSGKIKYFLEKIEPYVYVTIAIKDSLLNKNPIIWSYFQWSKNYIRPEDKKYHKIPQRFNTISCNTISSHIMAKGETMKRIQETVSDEAKAKLVAHAEKHNLTQGEALDAILIKVEE